MQESSYQLNQKAKQLAKDYLSMEAQLLEVLMEMRQKKLFIELGYSGIYNYCLHELKLSEAQSYYFKKVAEKSEEVPQLSAAIKKGELNISNARRIVPVVTSQNIEDWIGKAQTLTQKELEREVATVNPNSHKKKSVKEKIKVVSPKLLELKVGIDTETEKLLNRLKDILAQKRQETVNLSEVLRWLAQEMVQRHDPLEKAKRASYRKKTNAPKPKTSPVKPVNKSAPVPDKKSQPWTRTGLTHRRAIPAVVKHIKWQSSGGQCEAVSLLGNRCREKRRLELHHRIPVSQGGADTVQNLSLVCRLHHQYFHQQTLWR